MPFPRAPFFAFTSLAMVLAAGCSSSIETTPGTTSGGATEATTSAGSGGAQSGSTTSGSGGDTFDGGAPLATIESGIGPINTGSGEEHTQCITVNLKNAEGAFVRRFRADLGTGSHHMIVYKSNATSESTVPQDCQGFSGLLSGEHPIFIAQQAKAKLDFPNDESGVPVALEIEANQMVRIELHFINTTSGPLDVTGKLFVDTVPLGTTVVKSDLAFWGTKQVSVPANGTGDTGVKFQKALANSKTFALTTHQHHLGTRMRVWYAKDASDISAAPKADGQNWSDPPLELFTPALDFPDSGNGKTSSMGLAYRCEWKNPTATDVQFGEGFNDEMCFLWQYYYPSQGFQLCVDGFCKKVK
jgi:copper type II ascorbate-dependent monooxygenase-like protein